MNSAGARKAEQTTLLEVDGLDVAFRTSRGVVQAVSHVSLEIGQAEVVGVAGESGSGKTVLARSLMGLTRDGGRTRVSGSIRFAGRELSILPDRELARLWGSEIAMVFQDPMTSLNPVKRVGSQIAESLRLHLSMGRAEARTRAAELLHSVGLSEPERRLRQYPHEMSGGTRQRVTIAIALSCGPRLLLADEPTTALDVTVQAQVLDLLQQRQEENGMAMVLVSHDLRVLQGRTDRLIIMYGGEIVEAAPTRSLFAAPAMPYTRLLMDAAPPNSGPPHTRLQVIPGRPPDLVDPPAGCRFSPRCPYAQDRCVSEHPPLRKADSGAHYFRCWYPLSGSPAQIPEQGASHSEPQFEAIWPSI
jgi:peptide/nickel transport system ATP-binding protein